MIKGLWSYNNLCFLTQVSNAQVLYEQAHNRFFKNKMSVLFYVAFKLFVYGLKS
jgi:hypothetical protein